MTSEATATQACGSCVGAAAAVAAAVVPARSKTAAKFFDGPKAVKDSHLLRGLPRKLSVLGVLGVAAKSPNRLGASVVLAEGR